MGSHGYDDRMVAQASDRVIVTTEEIVDYNLAEDPRGGYLVPWPFVSMIVHVPNGAHPGAMKPLYETDAEHMQEYFVAAGTDEGFQAYLDKYIIGHTEEEYQRMVRQYDTRAAFEEALKQQGWTPAELRYDLEREALVGNYVQIRYRDVIDVRETEIRRYYEEVLRPEMAREGAEMPAFEAVDSMIEAILVGAEYNRRIDDWIAGLRGRADIVVYLW